MKEEKELKDLLKKARKPQNIRGGRMSDTKAISEAFESFDKALESEVPGCVRKWMFGDFEMSPELEKVVTKHFRKMRRGVKWTCLKYKILITLTVWRVKLKRWLKV